MKRLRAPSLNISAQSAEVVAKVLEIQRLVCSAVPAPGSWADWTVCSHEEADEEEVGKRKRKEEKEEEEKTEEREGEEDTSLTSSFLCVTFTPS